MKTYELFRDVITSQNFKLDEMRAKIKRSYITGDITEEEQSELLTLASSNVNHEAERPEWLEIARKLDERISFLEEEVKVLKNGETTPEDSTDTPQYEKWTPWDGISDKYQLGDIVEHNGVLYESTFSRQNTWEPGVAGTEALWKVYEVVV